MPSLFQKTAATSPVDKAAAAVDRVAQQHNDAVAALDRARAEYADTLANVVAEDAANLPKLADARAKLSAAETNERNARDALEAVRARHGNAQAAQQRDARAKAYDEAHRAAVRRAALAESIQRHAEALAKDYAELVEQSNTMLRALPDVPDMDAALLRGHVVEQLVRVEMVRQGLPFGSALQPRHEIQPLADKLATTPDLLKRWKAADLGASHD
ncbi:hypothetical protein [Dyella ginsengisoli]|uniref:hypothetical protein n=1 Tax=Dyella ginsengisoli TaxID=363848 RepID=UPI00034ABCBF|nr:hypothetical protein [Dyella ginsengisoli]